MIHENLLKQSFLLVWTSWLDGSPVLAMISCRKSLRLLEGFFTEVSGDRLMAHSLSFVGSMCLVLTSHHCSPFFLPSFHPVFSHHCSRSHQRGTGPMPSVAAGSKLEEDREGEGVGMGRPHFQTYNRANICHLPCPPRVPCPPRIPCPPGYHALQGTMTYRVLCPQGTMPTQGTMPLRVLCPTGPSLTPKLVSAREKERQSRTAGWVSLPGGSVCL